MIQAWAPAMPSLAALLSVAVFGGTALGHGHHGVSHISEGDTISDDPIDVILWAHIFIQMFAYGIVFPVGMVFGISKSRWHVPTQVFGTALAILGFFLGHMHKGREFVGGNAHAKFAHVLQILLVAQVTLGVYLKLHLEKGINGKIRKLIRPCHSVIGKAIPVFSWAQMLLGGITALGFCQDKHVGQCSAHFIMGSAFIGYGIVLTIMLLVGQVWLRRRGRSQEFFDNAVIAAWGCVNTFTEHRWGSEWSGNDWQHTTMGIVWWAAGLAGMWLSSDREGNPKRNIIPGLVLIVTGWAMSAHPQELMVSAATHTVFGYTLIGAGVARIVEISFVLRDQPAVSKDGRSFNSFQYLPIFLLYAAGFMFLSATQEQMELVDQSAMDHVAYILIIFSLAFLMFLFTQILIHLYDRNVNQPSTKDLTNGHTAENGRVRDAEEFELEGLTSDDEGDESRGMLRNNTDRTSLDSHSTVGKHNENSTH